MALTTQRLTFLDDASAHCPQSVSNIHLRGGAKLNATQNLSLNARNKLHITAAKSSHTANFEAISGSMGNPAPVTVWKRLAHAWDTDHRRVAAGTEQQTQR